MNTSSSSFQILKKKLGRCLHHPLFSFGSITDETHDSKKGLTWKAISLLKRCIELDAYFAEPYSALASIYAEKGMYEDARVLHLKALEILPRNPDLINNYGAFLQQTGKLPYFLLYVKV